MNMKQVFSAFESIGDNCEFGFVQVEHGILSGSLLKWARIIETSHLVNALNSNFEGLYRFENLSPCSRGMVCDNAYKLQFHSEIPMVETDEGWTFHGTPSEIRAIYNNEYSKRIHLADKFISCLRTGNRVFVYKHNPGINHNTLMQLHQVLQKNGPNKLLYVRIADEDNAAGTVTQHSYNLFVGHISRFASYWQADDALLSEWEAICGATYDIVSKNGSKLGTGDASFAKEQALFISAKQTRSEATVREKIKFSGNTGNFFFQEALRKQMRQPLLVREWDDIPTNVDTLVIPMANFIRPHEDFGFIADAIEKADINKVVLAGIGAQSEYYDQNLYIPPGTRRLLSIAAERSTSIGVRGFYSAELLNKNGYKNVEVIGCPSLFYSCTPWAPVRSRDGCERSGIAVHATPTGLYRDKLAEFYEFAMNMDADYIMQSEEHILPILDSEWFVERESKVDFHVHYYKFPETPFEKLKNWYATKGRLFFDVEEWIAYASSKEFFMGCRFHGNVAALLAGTPALTLVFDSRTRELCEYARLPYILFEDFTAEKSIEYYKDQSDPSLFDANFKRLFERYKSFLDKNGILNNLIGVGYQNSALNSITGRHGLSNFSFDDRVHLLSVADFLEGDGTSRDFHEIMKRLRRLRNMSVGKAVESSDPLTPAIDIPSI